MKAMEEQIASLAGLVHHALSMGSDVHGPKEAIRFVLSTAPEMYHYIKINIKTNVLFRNRYVTN